MIVLTNQFWIGVVVGFLINVILCLIKYHKDFPRAN